MKYNQGDDGVRSEVERMGYTKSKDILFNVRNGKSKLKSKYTKDKYNCVHQIYYLGDTPLIMLDSEKSPTCSALIKLVKGREKVEMDIMDELRNINNIEGLEDGFEKIKNILALLGDGKYVLREINMIPTDGEGHYFWNIYQVGRYYNAGADIFYNGRYILGTAKFLIPSQGFECYDAKRVEFYRKQIRQGKELVGIAIEVRGFMALLIDGHHKATAAYLEGKTLKCITIISGDSYEKYETIDGEKKINNLLNKNKISCNHNSINFSERHIKNNDIGKFKTIFPDFKAIALSRLAKDTSEEKIEKLLNYNGNNPLEELEYILYYFSMYNRNRAKQLCFNILNRDGLQLLWDTCLEYLSQFEDDDIKSLFSNILENKNRANCLNYDINKQIINQYLNRKIESSFN